MHKLFSGLLLYGDNDGILTALSREFEAWEKGNKGKNELVCDILAQVKRIIDLSVRCAFENDLWQDYLTYLLITDENPFTLSCERRLSVDLNGSLAHITKRDLEVFYKLYHFDFSAIESDLGIDCFSLIRDFRADFMRERNYNANICRTVNALSKKIAAARDADEIFTLLTEHYRTFGVGMFGMFPAFRVKQVGENIELLPISDNNSVTLKDLVGIEIQKRALLENTEAFIECRPANNALLYGDSGTGKSTSVRALINDCYSRGLRAVELNTHQFSHLSEIISILKNRNYRFIIFIDDLSFEEDESEYKFLKAAIEGSLESRPDNILIYATSNRRHLIKETWGDRSDMEFDGEIHRSDTVEEKLSLSSRFGVLINYSSPDHDEFHEMVKILADREGIVMDENKLRLEANRWELRHGGLSGRTARQFVDYIAGKAHEEGDSIF